MLRHAASLDVLCVASVPLFVVSTVDQYSKCHNVTSMLAPCLSLSFEHVGIPSAHRGRSHTRGRSLEVRWEVVIPWNGCVVDVIHTFHAIAPKRACESIAQVVQVAQLRQVPLLCTGTVFLYRISRHNIRGQRVNHDSMTVRRKHRQMTFTMGARMSHLAFRNHPHCCVAPQLHLAPSASFLSYFSCSEETKSVSGGMK